MQETIAVLLATYNGEKFLKQQLDSILSQTYHNFKIYISDDCSTDATLKILQEYQERFPNKIYYTVNGKNIGYVKNFEKLLANCSEKYIAFSDQDDIWIVNKLEKLVLEMKKLEAKSNNGRYIVHSDLCMIDENGEKLADSFFEYKQYKLKEHKDLGHILGPSGVMGNTILINRLLRDIVLPFPQKLEHHDYWIGVNAELYGLRKTLKQPLVKYRIHSSNVSNSIASLNKKHFSIGKKMIWPYFNTNRKYVLAELLDNIEDKNDKKVLEIYLGYLNHKYNRLKSYYYLVRYSLVKRDFLFRIRLAFRMLLSKALT